MLVKFKEMWFAPGEKYARDKMTVLSGRRYRTGVHEVPESLAKYLPRSAEILEGAPEPEPEVDPTEELHMHDHGRAIAAEVAKQEEIADRRREALKKAREAKKAKAEAKKE